MGTVTIVITCFQGYVLYITDLQRSIHEMCSWQKLEHSVGLEVVVRVIGVVIAGMTRLSGTGGIGGLSGCDVILSGPTEGEDWD